MGRKLRDKRLLVAREMPPLYKKKPGMKYSHANDEVMEWISKRPGLLAYISDKLIATGYITYDSQTGKWQGADYERED